MSGRPLLLWVHDCPCHASVCMVWYGVVWYGVVWCGMVWCCMVWYGMVVCLSESKSSSTVMDTAMCITLCVIP